MSDLTARGAAQMSDELVKRLGAQRQNWYDGPTQDFHQVQDPLCAEAAARIRLLEQQLKTAREALEPFVAEAERQTVVTVCSGI